VQPQRSDSEDHDIDSKLTFLSDDMSQEFISEKTPTAQIFIPDIIKKHRFSRPSPSTSLTRPKEMLSMIKEKAKRNNSKSSIKWQKNKKLISTLTTPKV